MTTTQTAAATTEMTNTDTTEMLTGKALIAKVKEMNDAPAGDIAKACGYYSIKDDGSIRVNFCAYYEAVLNAKGIEFGGSSRGIGKGGRRLPYVAVVQGNGCLLVDKAYMQLNDSQVGDEYTIKVSKNQIRLIKKEEVN